MGGRKTRKARRTKIRTPPASNRKGPFCEMWWVHLSDWLTICGFGWRERDGERKRERAKGIPVTWIDVGGVPSVSVLEGNFDLLLGKRRDDHMVK